MKEYKLVLLNKKATFSRQKDLDDSQTTLDSYIADGWELMQIITPNDLSAGLIGVFYRETQHNI